MSSTLDLTELGNRIRQARERLGLSQEEFANRVNKDQTAISEYENGKRRVSITELPLVASVLQVPILYFFEDALSVDDLDRALLDEFHRLPDERRSTVIEIMRLLADMSG